MTSLFDDPLDDEELNKAVGLISRAVMFKDSKGKKFTQEQIDFLRVWSNELFTTGFLMAKEQYDNK